MPNILDTLKHEHDELRELFAQLNATTDRAEDLRTELLHKMEAVLIPHAKWEETVFYPALSERADPAQQLLEAEAMTEHRAVEKAVLPDLHAADVGSRQFAGTAAALSHLIEHHSREEETQIFQAMRQLYSADELADFDRQYAEWKDSAVSTAITAHAKLKTAAMSALRSPGAPG